MHASAQHPNMNRPLKSEGWMMKKGHKNPSMHSFRAWQIADGSKNIGFLHKETVVKGFIVESVKFIGCSRLRIGLLLQRSLSFSTELGGFHLNLSLDDYFSFQGGPQFSSCLSIPVSESPHPLHCLSLPVHERPSFDQLTCVLWIVKWFAFELKLLIGPLSKSAWESSPDHDNCADVPHTHKPQRCLETSWSSSITIIRLQWPPCPCPFSMVDIFTGSFPYSWQRDTQLHTHTNTHAGKCVQDSGNHLCCRSDRGPKQTLSDGKRRKCRGVYHDVDIQNRKRIDCGWKVFTIVSF